MALGKEAILEADDLLVESVSVPEWGGSVLVRGLNSFERDKYQNEHIKVKGMGAGATVIVTNAEAALAVKCIVDEDGKRLFGEADVHKLASKSGAAIHRIIEVIERLSGLVDSAVEAAEENFDEGPTDVSPSS